jgi:Raf kinase inhibitor-like YbhB/YbcL family protein
MHAEPVPIVVESVAFAEGQTIPTRYTGDGANVSPPLTWSGVPEGTQSLVLICEDPDAPRGTWSHWVLFALPADTRELAEGIPPQATLPNGAAQGTNDFGNPGYGGPAPPPGKPHRYFFRLYALDTRVTLRPGAKRQDVLTALEGHILGQGQLMGTYGRQKR